MIWTVREAFVAGFGLFTSTSFDGSPNGKLCWRKRDDFVRAARKCHGDWVTFRPSRLKEALVCGPLVVTLRSEPLTTKRIVTTSRTRRNVTAQDRPAVTAVNGYQSHGRTFMASDCFSACVTTHFLGE